jgi:2-oxoglutarate ferredoxin oxidoreductase subunit alpha
MYHRPTEGTERFLREKFAKRPDLAEANVLAFRPGTRTARPPSRSP